MGKFNKFNFNKNKKNKKSKNKNKNYNNNNRNNKSNANNYGKYYNYSSNKNNHQENSKNKIYKNFIPKNNKYVQKDKKETQTQESFKEFKVCSLCKKKIIDDTTSFYIEDEDRYLCFDCAIKEIKNKFNISSKNKIIYLGSGTFGEIREIKSENTFVILRRIQLVKPKYEKFTSSYLQNTKIEEYNDKDSE